MPMTALWNLRKFQRITKNNKTQKTKSQFLKDIKIKLDVVCNKKNTCKRGFFCCIAFLIFSIFNSFYFNLNWNRHLFNFIKNKRALFLKMIQWLLNLKNKVDYIAKILQLYFSLLLLWKLKIKLWFQQTNILTETLNL